MAASLQFVRKLSGINVPSKTNEEAYNRAIKEVALVARNLLDSLVTNAEPRNREIEIQRARSRAAKRFGTNDEAKGPAIKSEILAGFFKDNTEYFNEVNL